MFSKLKITKTLISGYKGQGKKWVAMGMEIVIAVDVLHLELHVLAYQVSMVSAANLPK